jgi:hypothetical protein
MPRGGISVRKSIIVLALHLGLAQLACVGMADTGKAAGVAKAAAGVEKDVHGADMKLNELADALRAAGENLGKKEFPADLSTKLAALTIPFDASNLNHRALTDLPTATLKALLDYTAGVQGLNASVGKLKDMLTTVRPLAEKAFKEEREPVVSYSVIFRAEGAQGVMALIVPNKEPFKLTGTFPKEYVVLKPEMKENGQPRVVEARAKRWEAGGLTGSDPIAVPVAPETTAFFADRVIPLLRGKIIEQLEAILGRNMDMPDETPGLIKKGEEIEKALHKIASVE